ncbi:MAG TPA: hypothetical protein PKY59_16340 [Pyrinomonadaceae bacterium]|nr:hypothetical protein [Pyrinomonadaceae bacterium]
MKQKNKIGILNNKRGFSLFAALFVLLSAIFYFGVKSDAKAEKNQNNKLAKLGDAPKIYANKRGNPWINLKDGTEIETDLEEIAEIGLKQPRALASADFDEDGTPDIVAGYKTETQRGAAVFMRGNVDAVYPNNPEARERKRNGEFTDSPFIAPFRTFTITSEPDFLVSGDFDADGHFDIAAAKKGESEIYFFSGDGKGDFTLTKKNEVNGEITAILSDDFNVRDGVNELFVGVQIEQKGQVLIFEHPYGAMKAIPEVFDFESPIKSFAVNLLEGDLRFDLAIATQNEIAILRGRNRDLLTDESGKNAEKAKLTKLKFDFELLSLAIGDFIREEKGLKMEIAVAGNDGKIHLLENGAAEDAKGNLAGNWKERESINLNSNFSEETPILLTARISARPADTLVVSSNGKLELLTSDILPPQSENEIVNYKAQKFDSAVSLDVAGKAVSILPLRLNIDALTDLVVMRENSLLPTILQTAPMNNFVVDSDQNAGDPRLTDGICALPPCPPQAGAPCQGKCSYWAARDQIIHNGGSGMIRFNIDTDEIPSLISYSEWRIFSPITIDGSSQRAGFVELRGVSANNPALYGAFNGSNVFRGLVINGFGDGGHFRLDSENNIVEGCRIGTNSEGSAVVPNGTYGVTVANTSGAGNNQIGGTTPFARNIISMGDGVGISLVGVGTNRAQGNYVGTDVTGNVALGNYQSGIILSYPNSLVGGTSFGSGNVIAGTQFNGIIYGNGIDISGGVSGIGKIIQGNRIGTNASGTAALGNSKHGIAEGSATSWEMIGGTIPSARNIISGNTLNGIYLSSGSGAIQTYALGNYVGTNLEGNAAIPNGNWGFHFYNSGRLTAENNVVSGNTLGGGQFVVNAVSLGTPIIAENIFGASADGNSRLGNSGPGLRLNNYNGARVRDNIVAANVGDGIVSDSSSDNVYERNFVGTNRSFSTNLGNTGNGFNFPGSSLRNIIGGAGGGNTIAHNTNDGININFVSGVSTISSNRIFNNNGDGISVNGNSTEHSINDNSIYNNGDLGIDLNSNGVTPNDNCDNDFGGNRLQNYPVLSNATRTGSNIRIVGSLNSVAGQTFILSFYVNRTAESTGFGEGERFIGTATVNVPTGCNAGFSVSLPRTLENVSCVSATASDSAGNTSEFSRCVPVRSAENDFDADGLSDLTVWRPSNGVWYELQSSDGQTITTPFGISTDRIVPADYDGDAIPDIAVFRNGTWYILRSQTGFTAVSFGIAGDIPVPADYDGDGRAEIGVFRNGVWYILNLTTNQFQSVQFGTNGDKPVPADYDGDGRTDFAVYRNGIWYILRSSQGFTAVSFGLSTDRPTVGDYDGDGRADQAVYRNGNWYLLQSQAGFGSVQFGISTDIPVPSDYDGDGKTDVGVYRGGNWYLLRSTAGFGAAQFGTATDQPIPSAFIP